MQKFFVSEGIKICAQYQQREHLGREYQQQRFEHNLDIILALPSCEMRANLR
jgi:hypothetical protein